MDAYDRVPYTTTATFFTVVGSHRVPLASRVRHSAEPVPTTVLIHTAIVETGREPRTSLPPLPDIAEDHPERGSEAPETTRPYPSVDKCETDGHRTGVPYYVVIGKNWADGWTIGPHWTSLRGPQSDGRVPVVGTVLSEASE